MYWLVNFIRSIQNITRHNDKQGCFCRMLLWCASLTQNNFAFTLGGLQKLTALVYVSRNYIEVPSVNPRGTSDPMLFVLSRINYRSEWFLSSISMELSNRNMSHSQSITSFPVETDCNLTFINSAWEATLRKKTRSSDENKWIWNKYIIWQKLCTIMGKKQKQTHHPRGWRLQILCPAHLLWWLQR